MIRTPALFRPFAARAGAPAPAAKAVLNYLAVCVAVVAVVWASLAAAGIALNFDFIAQYRVRIWDGFCMTVGISAASLVISLIIGVAVAAGQGARVLPVRYLCDLYVKIIRGTPLIVQVYFFYYIIGTAWGVSNRELADLIHVSEGRFSHLFKESAGMAPLQYINKVRLEKAANLLKRGDYTVAEVAAAVGFSDYNHFGRLFRRTFGCAPVEARKNSRII